MTLSGHVALVTGATRGAGRGMAVELVDDTWGGDQWIEWKPLWEHDLDKGLRALRNGLETHLITLHEVLPLMVRRGSGLVVEITDGDDMFNSRYRGTMFFDMIKVAITRLG